MNISLMQAESVKDFFSFKAYTPSVVYSSLYFSVYVWWSYVLAYINFESRCIYYIEKKKKTICLWHTGLYAFIFLFMPR